MTELATRMRRRLDALERVEASEASPFMRLNDYRKIVKAMRYDLESSDGQELEMTFVTAERDQARQMLADAEQKIASMELDASLREEDERFADPL